MTLRHAIIAVPRFDAPNRIEVVRNCFDPQASLLPAHVTLVFPFVAANDTSVLREHIASGLVGVACFEITLEPPSAELDEYLFLRVQAGRERIIDLHDRLYSGTLQRHLSRAEAYVPHVTVGRLRSTVALTAAETEARRILSTPLSAHINSVSLFCIEAGVGRIDFTLPLASFGQSGLKPSVEKNVQLM